MENTKYFDYTFIMDTQVDIKNTILSKKSDLLNVKMFAPTKFSVAQLYPESALVSTKSNCNKIL